MSYKITIETTHDAPRPVLTIDGDRTIYNDIGHVLARIGERYGYEVTIKRETKPDASCRCKIWESC